MQKTFSALSKQVAAEELVNHVEFLRNQIASLVSDARRRKGGVGDGEFLLPGFNIPKGKFLCKGLYEWHDVMNAFSIFPTYIVGVVRLVFLIAVMDHNVSPILLDPIFNILIIFSDFRIGTTSSNFPTRYFVRYPVDSRGFRCWFG